MSLRLGNGPEFISVRLTEWAENHGVELDFIEKGKPTQNAYIDRFNRTYRTEIFDLSTTTRTDHINHWER